LSTIFSITISIFFIMPFLGFILVFTFFQLTAKNTSKSIHRATDYSTFFFIMAVHFLLETIWGKSFLWIIFILMILIAMVLVFFHWKVREEIDIKKVMKGFWRVNFLIFCTAYITLTLYGLITRVITFTFS